MRNQSWTDQIVGARMTVDQEFASEIASSRFSNQQWSLIMTATDFEIEQPDDPEAARIVANTEKVEQIIPELENVQSQMGAMGGAATDAETTGSEGGFVDSVKRMLGMDEADVGSNEKLDAAERLTAEYAQALQDHLESNGQWESVRTVAAEENA